MFFCPYLDIEVPCNLKCPALKKNKMKKKRQKDKEENEVKKGKRQQLFESLLYF